MDVESRIRRKTELDPSNMYEHIADFPRHLEDGKKIAGLAQLPDIVTSNVDQIVVCGMGGSAIGADLVRSYLGSRLRIPMAICRHYRLPSFTGKNTLVIGSSYSGNTEETLASVAEASHIGASVICVTTGGKLEEMAGENGWNCINIPSGLAPRAALGYSFVPLLMLMSRLGFVPGCDSDLDNAISAARARVKSYAIDSDGNKAEALAENMQGRIPIIYSGPDNLDAVAVRFKGQICENSKQLAFVNVYPELNHNELVGWEIYEPFADKLISITLRDVEDHPRVAARMKIVNSLLSDRGIKTIELNSDGDNLLSRMISLVQLGDFASFYLAMLNRVDPTPVNVIDYLKSELERL